ncbi:MAG: acyl-CoA dehydrogenase family protein [Acidobacteria bacterium]|nr:acyl-CoA dehydrogenase family protein [Acidobacteriota bacterium]
MDLSPSRRLEEVLGKARGLVEELEPLERVVLGGSFSAAADELEAARARAREIGLWLPQMPREVGGLGLSVLEHGHVSEILGRSPLGHYVCNCQAPDAGNMEILHEFGTAEQKERFLAPLLAGEVRSCFSMTEPDRAGSNPVWLETRAVSEGDDYVLDGRKWFTSGADGAAFAIVMAVTDPAAERHRRATQILVPTDTPGFELVRNVPVLGHSGDGWASHGEVLYRGCRVPRAHRLGEEGSGFAIAQARLGPGRIHHCMRWIGVAERSFDLMCRRSLERELAPGEPLADRQTIRDWIAESRAEIDAARLLVLDTAARIDRDGAKASRERISMIKYHVAGVMLSVVDRAVQVHGAYGLTDATVLSWFYTQERGARIYDGPDEVHKGVVAKLALRRYGPRSD